MNPETPKRILSAAWLANHPLPDNYVYHRMQGYSKWHPYNGPRITYPKQREAFEFSTDQTDLPPEAYAPVAAPEERQTVDAFAAQDIPRKENGVDYDYVTALKKWHTFAGSLESQLAAARDAALSRAEAAENYLRKLKGEWTRVKKLFPAVTKDGWMDLTFNEADAALTPSPASAQISKEGGEPCAPSTQPTQEPANVSTLQSTSTESVDIAGASNTRPDGPTPSGAGLLPFDLEKALAGAKVVTRSGRKISRIEEAGDGIIDAWTELGDSFTVWSHGGYRFNKNAHPLDLFLASPSTAQPLPTTEGGGE